MHQFAILIDRSTGQTFDERIFQRLEGLSSFALPDGVTSIGESAFGFCSGLAEIHIPDSVISIDEGAFNRCNSLTKISPKGSDISNAGLGNDVEIIER